MELKVVTFNLRLDRREDGVNYFFNRAPYILQKIQKEKPDIIGFQEAKEPIYEWLKANLYDYHFVGIGREDDFSDEANPIAYRKDRFELFGFQQFWLSPTPNKPGTRYEEQSICPRICCYAKLKALDSTKVVSVYNTHLDHVGEGARLLGMKQILSFMRAQKAKNAYPMILTGDMNACPSEAAIREVSLQSELGLLEASAAVKHSFHGYHGGSAYTEGDKIDYVFTDLSFDAEKALAWEECYGGIYLSDHYPIAVTLTLA